MKPFTLTNDDINSCIELASDGINIYLADQSKIDLIHKIMYAIAETAQHNQQLKSQLEPTKSSQFTIQICKYYD